MTDIEIANSIKMRPIKAPFSRNTVKKPIDKERERVYLLDLYM